MQDAEVTSNHSCSCCSTKQVLKMCYTFSSMVLHIIQDCLQLTPYVFLSLPLFPLSPNMQALSSCVLIRAIRPLFLPLPIPNSLFLLPPPPPAPLQSHSYYKGIILPYYPLNIFCFLAREACIPAVSLIIYAFLQLRLFYDKDHPDITS